MELQEKELPPPVHEYKFDEIEYDENLGGNTKQIKTQDATIKQPEILHFPTQRVRLNKRVDVIPDII